MSRKRAETASKYCILRDDERLKDLIKYKIESAGLTRGAVAKGSGISPWVLSHYLNHRHYENTSKMSQIKLLRVCGFLGIEVSLNLEITKQII
jgi:hypothetical protein